MVLSRVVRKLPAWRSSLEDRTPVHWFTFKIDSRCEQAHQNMLCTDQCCSSQEIDKRSCVPIHSPSPNECSLSPLFPDYLDAMSKKGWLGWAKAQLPNAMCTEYWLIGASRSSLLPWCDTIIIFVCLPKVRKVLSGQIHFLIWTLYLWMKKN